MPTDENAARPADSEHLARRRAFVAAAAGCYVLVQLTLPLFVLLRPGPTWRDFSWDMFSHGLHCSKLDALASTPKGALGSVRLDLDFSSLAQLRRVLVPGRLETYAAGLCAKLREEQGQPVQLRFIALCQDDRNAPSAPLVDPQRDYCATTP